MKKIGLLYICIGEYDYFWDGFYTSFEKNFLPGFDKEYFVFTDHADLKHSSRSNVHITYQEDLGWPGNTLYRYRMFLGIRDEIERCDYVFFINANTLCMTEVEASEVLPREGESLVAVLHPGYYSAQPRAFPYERRPWSSAWMPFCSGKGKHYFCGGINGGTGRAFMQMAETIDKRIRRDDRLHIRAVWNDESHINRYFAERNDCRILDPSFAYPEDWDIPFDCRFMLLEKRKYIRLPDGKN